MSLNRSLMSEKKLVQEPVPESVRASVKAELVKEKPVKEKLVAGMDLGANSFHMVIARLVDNQLIPVDSIAEKVQLIAGVDEHKVLSEEAILRGLSCLQRFKERIKNLPRESIRIVGTSTLRISRNSKEFISRAEKLLGLPVSIVSGHEEARLIYLGIAHTQKNEAGKRFVIDIGGGSTEFIIGQDFAIEYLASKHIGCVLYKERFLTKDADLGYPPDTNHSGFNQHLAGAIHKMIEAAKLSLLDIQNHFLQFEWSTCIGCSGAIRSIHSLLKDKCTDTVIKLDNLYKLKHALIHDQCIDLENMNFDRRSLLPSSLAILIAIFEIFRIKEMRVADGALREGLIYDMLGSHWHQDVRQRTIDHLMHSYKVDKQQADRVKQQVIYIYNQVKQAWQIDQPELYDMLCWAVSVHEIGLAISRSKYQKHSAYILKYSDLPGFSEEERQYLSMLVFFHRKRIVKETFKSLSKEKRKFCKRLVIILRLAVLLHRSRDNDETIAFNLGVNKKRITLSFGSDWLSKHPLTSASLVNEVSYLAAMNYLLKFK